MAIGNLSTASTVKFPKILLVCILVGIFTLPTHQVIAQDCSCGAPCYVLLDYDNIFGIEDFVACLTIEGGPVLVVEPSADVTLTAGESITLIGGFSVSNNATFSMEIDPLLFCDVTIDLDSDESDACLDCDDDNSSIHPGATEVCDGLDNDCNEQTDEGSGASCDDGVSCTVDSCDGVNGCSVIPEDSLCGDGFFCNGVETCDGGVGCLSGTPPCPGPDGDADCSESCSEGLENCTANDPDSSVCDDGNSCTSSDVCGGGSCMGTPIVDAYETNNSRGSATNIGSIDDDDTYPAGTLTATLYGPGDEDWYKFHVTDTHVKTIVPTVELENIPAESGYNLCAYIGCDDPGPDPSVTCNEGTTSSWDGLPGCCSSNSGSSNEHVSFNVDCDNAPFLQPDDNDGWIYVRVYKASGVWSCGNYSLPWGDN